MEESNKTAKNLLEIEIKLSINKKLYEEGYITEDIYERAKNCIISA